MSVSLVVLRFEIADELGLPKSLYFPSFEDNKQKMTEKVNKIGDDQPVLCTEESAASDTTTTAGNGPEEGVPGKNTRLVATAPSDGDPAQDAVAMQRLLKQHRGSREMKEIRIETMVFTNTQADKADPEAARDAQKDQSCGLGAPDDVQPKPPDPRPEGPAKPKGSSSSPNPSRAGRPAAGAGKNKRSKRSSGTAATTATDAITKKQGKEAAATVTNGTSKGGPEAPEMPKAETAEQSIPKEEAGSDHAATTNAAATRSYASIVSGAPIPQMVELETQGSQTGSVGDGGGGSSPSPTGSGTGDGKHTSKSPLSKHQSVLPFFSGNPSVELTKGILHLFKENQMTPLDEGVPRSEMLCMLAVPAVMTCHDLLQLAAPLSQGIQLLRIIRDATPNQYMVLIKFKQQKDADEFYSEFNGKPFNSIESSVCYLVYVSRVECMKASEGATLSVSGLTELPTCHICLERMDESVDGILTILCNHSFHGNCLEKWGDTSCPVCRYCQTPEAVEDHKCFTCGAQESLWICLICGHVGCGRYSNRHSYSHFEETQHTYAMQLGNQRVWDYAGDNYVHRLVQSKGDGKPIEWDRQDTETAHSEKLDSLQLEYSYLLTSQLDSQRTYFEDQMARIEQDALNRMSEVEARSRKTVEERDKMEQCLQTAFKEKAGLERKCSQLSGRLSKVTADLKEEKEMNRCLRDNQQLWQTRVTELERKYTEDSKKKQGEIDDLREQLRDLMFYLDAQQKIGSTSEDTRQEIQDGQIVIGEATSSPSQSSSSSRKGRKKGR